MITVEWWPEFSADHAAELAALIAEAAEYDDEAGFSTAVPDAGTDGGVEVYRALARLTPGLHGSTETPLAAFLRLDVDRAGGATAQLLVHPRYRSLGIGTLMLELLSASENAGDGDGWAGTGAISISCWAHGSHPAAERMAERLGAEAERGRWKLMRGDEVLYVEAEDEVAVAASRRDGFVHEHTDVCYVLRVPATITS